MGPITAPKSTHSVLLASPKPANLHEQLMTAVRARASGHEQLKSLDGCRAKKRQHLAHHMAKPKGDCMAALRDELALAMEKRCHLLSPRADGDNDDLSEVG